MDSTILLLIRICNFGCCSKQSTIFAIFAFHSVAQSYDKILNGNQPGRVAQSVGHSLVRGPGFDTRSGHILSFLLPLIQERQLSVTGESICTKYWLSAKEVQPAQKKCG